MIALANKDSWLRQKINQFYSTGEYDHENLVFNYHSINSIFNYEGPSEGDTRSAPVSDPGSPDRSVLLAVAKLMKKNPAIGMVHDHYPQELSAAMPNLPDNFEPDQIHSNFRKDVYAIIASLNEHMPEEARIDAEIMHLMCIVHQAREISGFLNEHRLRILMKRINDEMMRHSRINYYIGHFLKAGLGFR